MRRILGIGIAVAAIGLAPTSRAHGQVAFSFGVGGPAGFGNPYGYGAPYLASPYYAPPRAVIVPSVTYYQPGFYSPYVAVPRPGFGYPYGYYQGPRYGYGYPGPRPYGYGYGGGPGWYR